MQSTFLTGLLLGLSLILAIGPQNIYLIEQGLKKTKSFSNIQYLLHIGYYSHIYRNLPVFLIWGRPSKRDLYLAQSLPYHLPTCFYLEEG